ncbi:MAG: hypothetical protein ACRDM1_04855 [Gaiellaceae bacterium]
MRRLVATLAASFLLATAGVAGAGGVPPFPKLPGAWSHAELNVTIHKQPHTLILDRGRIVQVSATQLTLAERVGHVVAVIPLSPRTIITPRALVSPRGRHGSPLRLRRNLNVQTMRIDGGPAVRVRVTR